MQPLGYLELLPNDSFRNVADQWALGSLREEPDGNHMLIVVLGRSDEALSKDQSGCVLVRPVTETVNLQVSRAFSHIVPEWRGLMRLHWNVQTAIRMAYAQYFHIEQLNIGHQAACMQDACGTARCRLRDSFSKAFDRGGGAPHLVNVHRKGFYSFIWKEARGRPNDELGRHALRCLKPRRERLSGRRCARLGESSRSPTRVRG